ncbi:hypothetical protein HK104_002469 [Borealophlyctis nickersoniae]|nr:hypothetical protein HK104_002469 [Borealophlyctis nickersoniae]
MIYNYVHYAPCVRSAPKVLTRGRKGTLSVMEVSWGTVEDGLGGVGAARRAAECVKRMRKGKWDKNTAMEMGMDGGRRVDVVVEVPEIEDMEGEDGEDGDGSTRWEGSVREFPSRTSTPVNGTPRERTPDPFPSPPSSLTDSPPLSPRPLSSYDTIVRSNLPAIVWEDVEMREVYARM